MRIRAARPDDSAELARVHVDTWRTAYRAILPADFLDALSYEVREQRWRTSLAEADPQQFTLLVEDDAGSAVGFVRGGPERDQIAGYDGEIYAIYLRSGFHRRGIGRQLMAAGAKQLAGRGFNAALVWVLAANGQARAFYEALGGRLLSCSKPITIGETPLIEVAYGWPNLRVLSGAGGC